jgi:imidazolonepropionase-like amidohydrolase
VTIRTLKLAPAAPLILAAALLVVFCRVSFAQGDADLEAPGLEPFTATVSGGATLFQNVRIFDGRSGVLSAPSNVLVKGGMIERLSAGPIAVDAHANIRTIAAGGRVLMPGLIDAHWHAFMTATPQMVLMTADPNYLQIVAARQGSDADEGFHDGT